MTLNRWHKVAERIGAAVRERETRVKEALVATTISSWNKEGIEEKAAAIATRAADDLAMIELGTGAVARIRATLAIRNAQLGVSERLAEAEAAKRRAALYRTVLEGQKADMVRPKAVASLPGFAGDPEPFGFGRRAGATVTLQTADDAVLDELRGKLADEEALATRLLDEVADFNRDKVEIDLAEKVLRIAGLAA